MALRLVGSSSTVYAGSKGPTRTGDNAAGSCPERAAWDTYNFSTSDNTPAGPFTRLGRIYCARLAEITDGLSNTLFVGEVRGNCSIPATRGWVHGSNLNGMISTIYPINYDSCSRDLSRGPCRWWDNWSTNSASSRCTLVERTLSWEMGQCIFVSQTIDHWTYQYLGGKSEGQVASIPN